MNIHPVDKLAGELLKQRRKELGLSQSFLGSSIDVSFQQIQKYERGINRMAASCLLELAIILKVPVSYFFEETLLRLERRIAVKRKSDRRN